MRKTKREFWDRIFPKTSRKIARRQFEGLSPHGLIEWDETERNAYLKYYKNHSETQESRLSVDVLQTGQSRNDQGLKSFIAGFQIALAFVVGYSPRAHELVLNLDTDVLRWAIMAVLVAVALPLYAIWFLPANHFIDINNEWTNSIRSILSKNIVAILGQETPDSFEPGAVSKCMLSFRRFIKWRRYLTFLDTVLVAAWFLEAVIFANSLAHHKFDFFELILAAVGISFQVLIYARISFLRWYYTNWRDPTVQICLALADWDRDLLVCETYGPGKR